jgi:thioesterase domain-containing protein
MIEQINSSLGVHLTVPDFFLNPTVECIAGVLKRDTGGGAGPKLIALRTERTEGAIFFLEATIGLSRLAQRLDIGLSSYASLVPMTSSVVEAAIENMLDDVPRLPIAAQEYVKQIETRLSSGPCVLIGHCYGGLLAFEVAHQLIRKGRRVDAIVMLDAFAPSHWSIRLKKLNLRRLRWAAQWRMEHLRNSFARFRSQGPSTSPQGDSVASWRPVREQLYVPDANIYGELLVKINTARLRGYKRRQLPSRGILVRAADAHLYDHFEDMRWGGLFKDGLEILDAPGGHESFLEDPNVGVLAQSLQNCLAQLIQTV